MSHHDVLDANHRGTNVILCDHTNTERGFLKYHEDTLETVFEKKVAVHIAEADHEPMEVVWRYRFQVLNIQNNFLK